MVDKTQHVTETDGVSFNWLVFWTTEGDQKLIREKYPFP